MFHNLSGLPPTTLELTLDPLLLEYSLYAPLIARTTPRSLRTGRVVGYRALFRGGTGEAELHLFEAQGAVFGGEAGEHPPVGGDERNLQRLGQSEEVCVVGGQIVLHAEGYGRV